MSTTLKILLPTDEEEAQINAGILSDADSFELSPQALAALRPAAKVVPEIVEAYQRGDFKPLPSVETKPNQQTVLLALSVEVLDYFKKSGRDWQANIDSALKDYIAQH
jgi:uncharacterized protein (DUF4415 family)